MGFNRVFLFLRKEKQHRSKREYNRRSQTLDILHKRPVVTTNKRDTIVYLARREVASSSESLRPNVRKSNRLQSAVLRIYSLRCSKSLKEVSPPVRDRDRSGVNEQHTGGGS